MTSPLNPLTPAGLRCAHKTDPLGVAQDRIRFSWILEGAGQAQTAYQIRVTQDDAVVWDSGRVESASTADVPYAGPPLTPGRRYRWKVQAWDETGSPSPWSAPAAFETQLDQTNGWHASWITLGRIREEFGPPSGPGPSDPVVNALLPPPYLRREFRVDQPVASARLYVTALGLYEARLNGQRVGDAVLAPGWTDYTQRIPYQTYDVTGLLRPGDNVLGAIAADGWACGFFGFDAKQAGRHYAEAPEFLAQLVLTLADGPEESRVQLIVTDGQWRAAFAAIRHADLLMGERHDLTREPRGWDCPGFDACHWRPVRVRERDATPLVADPGPPIRVTQEITPRSIATDDHGRHIVDFGQNLTGWLRISVDGTPGARVRIRHGEVLTPDGALYTDNLRTARAVDEFTTAGGAEVLEPRFTLHGFRYAEITGYPGDIEQADITAQVVHSDIGAAGSFASSQPWLDQLWRNIDWGQRGNFISVPTDCPQRDERLGWLADAQIFARTACYNRDVAAFFAKWLDDVADAQYDSGVYPDIAPRLNIGWAGAPAWADGGVIVPWTLWKMYGDTAILDRHFAGMTRWMEYLERANPGCLRTRELGNSYNDWLAPGEDKTPPELLASAYWAYDATLMAEMAEATGRAGEAAGYLALKARLRSAFIEAFVAADGQVTSGTQTALRPCPAHEPDPRRPARGRRRPPGRGNPPGGLAPDHGLRRRRLHLAGAQLDRPRRRRLPAARAGLRAVLAAHDRRGRHHDLGALGRLDEGARLPVRLDELLQPLRARLGGRVALPVRPGDRPGAGRGRFRPAPGQAASRRHADLGSRHLSVGARPGRQRLAAGRRPVHVLTRAAAERDRQRPDPQ